MVYEELKWQLWPVEEVNITGRFGDDYGGYKHRGLDLGPWPLPAGAPHIIYAPADGTMVEFLNSWNAEYNDRSFGIGVCLDHLGTEYFSLFAHLNKAYVNMGDKVLAGQAIGEMGWTGVVVPKGPGGKHLHWQVCKSKDFPIDISQSADPLSFAFAYNTPDAPVPAPTSGLTEAQVRAIVSKILDERGLEANFASAVSRRLALMSEATNLGNPAFNR